MSKNRYVCHIFVKIYFWKCNFAVCTQEGNRVIGMGVYRHELY